MTKWIGGFSFEPACENPRPPGGCFTAATAFVVANADHNFLAPSPVGQPLALATLANAEQGADGFTRQAAADTLRWPASRTSTHWPLPRRRRPRSRTALARRWRAISTARSAMPMRLWR
ncbi:hypothetical protein E6W36_05865 [Hankyongella ginsenosidimutans]|uniref:Uncharacterized protein n=1 Tax=Hankyongella ginsenosidimutans TaxID=1763828 RepID=A0A4D7C909_9SPHN|nr:hypothetical protein [Hankyongella ginsenosidimutans]QCI79257.1 hypothetical protein E6W36_05865 [Hankyongella ginsenosidimutans]